jgi:hypothetical protein
MEGRTVVGRWIVAGCLAVCIAAAPVAAGARDPEPESGGAAIGVTSMLCTLVYTPLKLAYAVSGVAVGSLAWIWSFGSKRVAKPIFRSALGGDYVVMPDHLRGKEKLRFRGRR